MKFTTGGGGETEVICVDLPDHHDRSSAGQRLPVTSSVERNCHHTIECETLMALSTKSSGSCLPSEVRLLSGC